MQSIAERSASIAQHHHVVIAQVGVACGTGHTAVGHNAAHHHGFNTGFAQHPIELGVENAE